ncbi:fasciclin domain-containing protein [Sphingomicrobium flavum]|uniref:fasciclin domain-containing protein n=1 Tax=Sphingomicrobium flavum TaxID=1229164 RepID=UPI0021AD94B9|nr:fasciclin domain-containing protein [Sphingomicrobium flavum]
MRITIIMAVLALAACEEPPRGMDNALSAQPAEHATMVDGTLGEMIAADEQFSSLSSAIAAASLGPTLAGDGPYTLFAPTNRAFAVYAPEQLQALLQPANQASLARMLSHHIVPGELLSGELIGRIERSEDGHVDLVTTRGTVLRVTMVDGHLVLGEEDGATATIVTMDLGANNGVIHVIDRLLPAPSAPPILPTDEDAPVDNQVAA